MEEISRVAVTYLVNALWQVPMIAAMAWVCLKLMRRVPVSYKHAIWVITLILAAAIPLLTIEGSTTFGLTLSHASMNPGSQSEVANLRLLPSTPRPFFSRMQRNNQFLSLSPLVTLPLRILYLLFLLYRIGRFAWARKRSLQLRETADSLEHHARTTNPPRFRRVIFAPVARKAPRFGLGVLRAAASFSPSPWRGPRLWL
jgi:hypothetical protein